MTEEIFRDDAYAQSCTANVLEEMNAVSYSIARYFIRKAEDNLVILEPSLPPMEVQYESSAPTKIGMAAAFSMY